ncbi:MAG TPA: hypothetical protein PKW56_10080 [Clostridiales bacterium]|nr:hypothetical protein [Clostridiales bacterium]
MRKTAIMIMVLTSFVFAEAELGIILGEPTGISFRSWTGSSNALDIQAGWSFNTKKDDHFDLHGAYLFGRKSDIRIEGYRLPWYFGPGGRIKFGEDEVVLGFKFPFGLYYKFRTAPFSAFFEIAPGMNITPSTDFDIMGGLGFRYIFSSGNSQPPPEEENAKRDRR